MRATTAFNLDPLLIIGGCPVIGGATCHLRKMNDDLRPVSLDQLCRNSWFQKVILLVLGDHQVDVKKVPVLYDMSAEETRCAGDQGPGGHCGASRSRSDMALTGSGHSTPMVGSRHNSERALA